MYIPIITSNDNTNIIINYQILLVSVSINLFAIIIGLFVSFKKYKYIQKVLGLAGLSVIVLSTLYTVYNLVFGQTLKIIFESLSFGALISPLIVEIFSYIFGFGITYFLHLPNQQIVAIALQCGNPNVYLSIAILYVTLQSTANHNNNAIDLALSMPILFTIYGTFITIILGIYLKKYKFITFKKHKKLKKLSHSLMSKFRHKKRKQKLKNKKNVNQSNVVVLKSISSSSSCSYDEEEEDVDDKDPIQVFKEKGIELFSQMPECAMQPEKILEYEYGDNYDEDEIEEQVDDERGKKEIINQIQGYTIDSESETD